jgi:hypothetical protein
MEEDEYKSTYNELVSVRCVFEKALTSNHARCHLSRHFCLADREGYACNDVESSIKCRKFLEILREKSTFVLKVQEIKGPLPHNMEIRVQVGGITGLAKLVERQVDKQTDRQLRQPMVEDIYGLIEKTTERIGPLETLPYSEIIQSVVRFKGRRRRQH